uniref:histone acetyltransferase n=1 Tax=Aplanochytrium stocchinoi TaxID=215587 RepID=A0A6S8D5C7_9STRA
MTTAGSSGRDEPVETEDIASGESNIKLTETADKGKNGQRTPVKDVAETNGLSTTATTTGNKKKDELGQLYKPGVHVWCKYTGDNSYRDSQIIEVNTLKNGQTNYYVHFVEFNRRMDTWVKSTDILDSSTNPHDPEAKLTSGHGDAVAMLKQKRERRKEGVVEFVEEEYGEHNAMDEASIREHEEVTKVKNVNTLELGRHLIDTWYFSPIPKELYPEGGVPILYMCEFSLDFFRTKRELTRHYKNCKVRHPPGDEIYRDEESNLAVFEVDGAKSKFYSQNLCYLAKFFLDHKTLHFDVDPFLFYVFCEFDEYGYHIFGFFSKEKFSEQGYNLACILTLPSYQRKGYGKFIIEFSYELSKKEKRVGSPEKPLSDLGQVSYRSFWARALLEALQTPAALQQDKLSLIDLACITSIKIEDIILTLNYLGIIKYVGGQHCIYATPEIVTEKLKQFSGRGPRVSTR